MLSPLTIGKPSPVAWLDKITSDLKVGEHLTGRLRELQQKHDIIGDVRGSGLMLGIELVKDRDTKAPATAETAQVKALE